MSESGRISLTQLTASGAEVAKLSPTEKKRYVMLTCILRDLVLLQKLLLFVRNDEPSGKLQTSARTSNIVFFLSLLVSKAHEAWRFLKGEGILGRAESCPDGLQKASEAVEGFFGDAKVAGTFAFVRDKFGFHYDTWDDLDPRIDSAATSLGDLEMWLSSSDSGNDLFTSTNEVVSAVMFAEICSHGYSGTRQELVEALFDHAFEASRLLLRFSRLYLAEGFGIVWTQGAEVQLDVPVASGVSLPGFVAPSD